MNKVMWSVSAASILAVTVAYAQADTPRIDQRQANQEQRIEKGLAGGHLTEREANRLSNQQERINRMEDRAKSDGVVSKKERKTLHAAQDRSSRKIAHQKHDQKTK
jgi:hypothetical protein